MQTRVGSTNGWINSKCKKVDVLIDPEITTSIGNVNKASGLNFSTIFKNIHFKNQSSSASGFYDVKKHLMSYLS